MNKINLKKLKQKQKKHQRIKDHETQKTSSLHQTPIFSLQYMQESHCISGCEKNEKAAFADKLRLLGKMTWNQINGTSRHKLGYEKIERKSIKSSIPQHIKEDENFIAFRFCGMKPMVGYREDAIFHIIWIDRNLKLYKH